MLRGCGTLYRNEYTPPLPDVLYYVRGMRSLCLSSFKSISYRPQAMFLARVAFSRDAIRIKHAVVPANCIGQANHRDAQAYAYPQYAHCSPRDLGEHEHKDPWLPRGVSIPSLLPVEVSCTGISDASNMFPNTFHERWAELRPDGGSCFVSIDVVPLMPCIASKG